MFAYIPISISIIYSHVCIIIMLLYCCFGRCKYMFEYGKASDSKDNENFHKLALLHDNNNNNNDQDIQLTKCSKFIRWAFSLLVIISLVFAIIYGTAFNRSVIKISNDWSDSYNDYEIIISDATQINNVYIPNAQIQCKLILNTSTAQPIYANISALNDTIGQCSKLIDQLLSSAQSVPSWDINDQIKPYREFAIIWPVISLVVFGLLMIFNYLCYSHDYLNKKVCCCSCSFLVVYLPLFIIIIAWIQFAVSVQIADGCDDPNNSIWSAVDQYNNNQETKDIIKYYLYCSDNDTLINPLNESFYEPYNILIQLNSSINELEQVSDVFDIVQEVDALSNDYVQTINLMNEINDTLQCETIDEYKDSMITELCGDGLDYWLIYYSMQIAFIVLLVFRSWSICTEDKAKAAEGSNFNDNNNFNDGYNNNNYGTHIDEGESALELGDRDSILTVSNNLVRIIPLNDNKALMESDSDDENQYINNDDREIAINIKCGNKEEVVEYKLKRNQTIADLMGLVEKNEGIDVSQQKLMYDGIELNESYKTIGDTIQNGGLVTVVILDLTLSTEDVYKYEAEQGQDLNLPQ